MLNWKCRWYEFRHTCSLEYMWLSDGVAWANWFLFKIRNLYKKKCMSSIMPVWYKTIKNSGKKWEVRKIIRQWVDSFVVIISERDIYTPNFRKIIFFFHSIFILHVSQNSVILQWLSEYKHDSTLNNLKNNWILHYSKWGIQN